MPVKRRASKHKPRLTPEMRPKAERLLELNEQHLAAIQGEDDSFYEDGRHEELVRLLPGVHAALGIAPWEDGDDVIRAALQAAN